MMFTFPEESIDHFSFRTNSPVSYLLRRKLVLMAKRTSSFLDCHMQVEEREIPEISRARNLLPPLMLCARALEEIFPTVLWREKPIRMVPFGLSKDLE